MSFLGGMASGLSSSLVNNLQQSKSKSGFGGLLGGIGQFFGGSKQQATQQRGLGAGQLAPSFGSFAPTVNFNQARSSMPQLISGVLKQVDSNIPTDYFMKMANIESRFNPDAVSPTGAKGLFQFTKGTWNDYGQGNRLDPVENTKAAVKLAESNQDFLKHKLRRDVKPHELYMAHNIGAGGAYKLLKAPENATVTSSLIGSNPKHNPKFFYEQGQPVTAGEARQRYAQSFGDF